VFLNQVRKRQRGRFGDVLGLNNLVGGENIFGFYLPTVLLYTSIERIQFGPLWVDGSRANASQEVE
jgi:hypothetical protein